MHRACFCLTCFGCVLCCFHWRLFATERGWFLRCLKFARRLCVAAFFAVRWLAFLPAFWFAVCRYAHHAESNCYDARLLAATSHCTILYGSTKVGFPRDDRPSYALEIPTKTVAGRLVALDCPARIGLGVAPAVSIQDSSVEASGVRAGLQGSQKPQVVEHETVSMSESVTRKSPSRLGTASCSFCVAASFQQLCLHLASYARP